MNFIHEQIIRDSMSQWESDPEVLGVLLQGSLARGDGYPTSDLDLFVLLCDGCQRTFASEEQHGILLEQHASDMERTVAKVRKNPMLAYGFTDGRILRDDTGGLAELVATARAVIDSYRISPEERAGILYWLQSAYIKIKAAADAGDLFKASFVVATTSWKILEGMWAINDLPMPPSGTVLAHKNDLSRVPENWDALFARLFQGDMLERIDTSLTLIDWLVKTDSA